MPVSVDIIEAEDLTVINYSEPFTLEEYIEAFPHDVTRNILVNFADIENLHWIDKDVQAKANEHSAQFDHLRKGGRTAIFAPSLPKEILAKLYVGLSEAMLKRPIEFKVFTDRREALDWLKESG
jgi:hypothetical protein